MTKTWSTSCLDWGDRIKKGESLIPPPIFEEQADQALAVFKELKIVDAVGSPTFGESAAPWVFDLVRSVFGAYDAESGRRLITEWFICVPKKNSKSSLAAGIMLTALILNWRKSAEFAVLAPTVEVAGNAYAPARDMVQKDDELDTLMHVQTHIKSIKHRESGAILKVLAADSNTVGGKKSVGTLVDELHLFGKVANAENMLREALGGLASRPEGFVIYLTTQSDEPPSGVFKQKLQYARDVRDGKIVDNAFLPVIFEHPDEMVANGECLKLENMWMTNPNIGYSVDQIFLEREYKKAEQAGANSFRGFMAKHANVEIGMNLRSDRWAGADYWQKQEKSGITLEKLIELCEVIDLGIDGGGLDDLLGLSAIGRTPDGEWLSWSRAWAHPSVFERRKDIAARLTDFANDGDLILVENIGDDVTQVAEICSQVYESGLLDKIGCDPSGLGMIVEAIVDADVPEECIIGISQGWKMTGAIKTTERKLAEKALFNADQALMRWCVSNAKVEPRGNAVIITKQTSGSAKIDPLMALFNAVTLMSLNPEASGITQGYVSL